MDTRMISSEGARASDRRRDRWLAVVLWCGLLAVLVVLSG